MAYRIHFFPPVDYAFFIMLVRIYLWLPALQIFSRKVTNKTSSTGVTSREGERKD